MESTNKMKKAQKISDAINLSSKRLMLHETEADGWIRKTTMNSWKLMDTKSKSHKIQFHQSNHAQFSHKSPFCIIFFESIESTFHRTHANCSARIKSLDTKNLFNDYINRLFKILIRFTSETCVRIVCIWIIISSVNKLSQKSHERCCWTFGLAADRLKSVIKIIIIIKATNKMVFVCFEL